MWLPLVFVAPHQANAQVVNVVRGIAPTGQTRRYVYITEANGRKSKARLGELSASTLEFLAANGTGRP